MSCGTAVRFSVDLPIMLGFDSERHYIFVNEAQEFTADKPLHMTVAINNVYVYCDLLEHVMVGNVKLPLLRIVHRTGIYDSIFCSCRPTKHKNV